MSARGQDVCDVLCAEGLQFQAVVDGTGNSLTAVHLGQREDLAQVHTRVHAPRLQALAVGLRARRQGQELHQQALLVGTLALHDELLRVFGQLDVLVPAFIVRLWPTWREGTE